MLITVEAAYCDHDLSYHTVNIVNISKDRMEFLQPSTQKVCSFNV